MKLSAYLIVKNESAMIAACLTALKDFDEIVVVDTGSTDDTLAKLVAMREDVLGNKLVVGHFAWIDDFSAARNYAASLCSGDWLFPIDADNLLLTKYSVVKAEAQKAEKLGAITTNVKCQYPAPLQQWHWVSGMAKRMPQPYDYWAGAVHECLTVVPGYNANVVVQIGQSPAKANDPDRNLRILLHADLTNPRNQFYLGKEYYERGTYGSAIAWMRAFLENPSSNSELHWARLVIANCYWRDGKGRGHLAREEALRAFQQNPMSRDTIRLLAEVHDEPWRSSWLKLLNAADDEGVLFRSGF